MSLVSSLQPHPRATAPPSRCMAPVLRPSLALSTLSGWPFGALSLCSGSRRPISLALPGVHRGNASPFWLMADSAGCLPFEGVSVSESVCVSVRVLCTYTRVHVSMCISVSAGCWCKSVHVSVISGYDDARWYAHLISSHLISPASNLIKFDLSPCMCGSM